MKLWKKRKKVPFKTFILELMVIDGCKGEDRNYLEPQLSSALAYIAENITSINIYDPANSGNIVSNIISIEQKNRIRNLANQAIKAKKWSEIFQ